MKMKPKGFQKVIFKLSFSCNACFKRRAFADTRTEFDSRSEAVRQRLLKSCYCKARPSSITFEIGPTG